MIYKVKLTVRDEVRWLVSMEYGYHIKFHDSPAIDKIIELHQEVSMKLGLNQPLPVEGGLFRLQFPSTDHDQFFYDWMIYAAQEAGCIEIFRNEMETESRINFWDCYCVGIEECMSAGGLPMVMELLLSPAIMKKDGIVHEKIWKVTDIHGYREMVTMSGDDTPPDQAHITFRRIIDEANQPVQGTLIQYVNLKKDKKYVDGTIVKGLHQLGPVVRAKVLFNKPGEHHFTLRLLADEGNAAYSAAEKSENPRLRHQEEALSLTTDSDGAKIIEGDSDLFFSQSGDSLYSISTRDDSGKKVRLEPSATIHTLRLLYYMEVSMEGLPSVPPNLDIFRKEYRKHGITFQDLPPAQIAHRANVGTAAEENQLKKELELLYRTSECPDKDPYCFLVVYVDQLADKAVNQELDPFRIVKGGPAKVSIPISDSKNNKYPLWRDIVPGEGWFVDCYFLEDGRMYKDRIVISEDKCKPVQTPNKLAGYCDSVEIDVSQFAGMSGEIYLTVHWVKKFRGGRTYLSRNIIMVATKSYWNTISKEKLNSILIHELGHKIGLVPSNLPNHYTGKGHQGHHCHAGLGVLPNYLREKDSTCVMFGEGNGQSAFCPDCAAVVKKADLSTGIIKTVIK